MKTIKIVLLSCVILFGFSIACYAYDIVQVTNTPEVDETDYSIAIFENTVYAVWRDEITGKIYFDKSTDLGKTWGQHRKVISASSILQSPKILTDKLGGLYICYLYDPHQRSYAIQLLKSTDTGETFFDLGLVTSPIEITPHTGSTYDVTIDEIGNIIYVIARGPMYNYDVNYTRDIYMWKSVDGGNTFSDRRTIFSLWAAGSPQIETSRDGKDVYLFLVQYASDYNILFTKSLDYGENFELLKGVPAYGRWRWQIDSALDTNGKIYVLCTVRPTWNKKRYVYLSESSDKGENFLYSPINDEIDIIDSSSSSISLNRGGNVYCAFLKDYGYPQKICFDKRFVMGKFGEDEYITGLLHQPVSRPAIAVTSYSNTGCIMWSNPSIQGGNRDIFCTTFGPYIEVGGPNPDYTTIQEAIDNSEPGDTVYVHPGGYHENLILKDGVSLEGSGKDKTTVYGTIKVGSNCILEGIAFEYEIPNTSSYILLKIASSNVIIKDCSFNLSYNGTASMSYGNFLAYLKGSNITLEGNNFNFTTPSSYYTRGIYAYACSDISLRKNRLTLKDNSTQRGYYIYGFQSINSKDITVENNIIDARGNNANGIYGILLTAHNAAFDNATVKNNTVFLRSNYPYNRYLTGIYSYQLAHLNIRNNIIDLGTVSSYYSKPCYILYYIPSADTDTNTSTSTGTNTDIDTDTYTISDIKVTYNIYDGAYSFVYKEPSNLAIIEHDNNIKANHWFINPEQGDFHLSVASPAIDAGDPNDDYSNEPQRNGGRIDCGAYGNTKEATVR